jgi:hypothetical protein
VEVPKKEPDVSTAEKTVKASLDLATGAERGHDQQGKGITAKHDADEAAVVVPADQDMQIVYEAMGSRKWLNLPWGMKVETEIIKSVVTIRSVS